MIPISKEYMSTLAAGWRFTLPARLREVKGWGEGTRLVAAASGAMLILSAEMAPREGHGVDSGQYPSDRPPLSAKPRVQDGESSPPSSDQLSWPAAPVRLGSGGKVIVPMVLRAALQWEPGKRLVVADDNGGLSISPCCGVKRCRSCGNVGGVREVIPNLYLCADCWDKYSRTVRSRPAPVKTRSW